MDKSQHLNPYRSLSSKFGTYLNVDILGDDPIKSGLLNAVIKEATTNNIKYIRLCYEPQQWQRDISGWYVPLDIIVSQYQKIIEQIIHSSITPIVTLSVPQTVPDWCNGDYHNLLMYTLDAHKMFIIKNAHKGIIWEAPIEPNVKEHWFGQDSNNDQIMDEWIDYCHQLYQIIWQYDHESIFLTGDINGTPQTNGDLFNKMMNHDLLDSGTALSLHPNILEPQNYLNSLDHLQWTEPITVTKYGFGSDHKQRLALSLQTTFILDLYRIPLMNYYEMLGTATQLDDYLYQLPDNNVDVNNQNNNYAALNLATQDINVQRPIICFGDSITQGWDGSDCPDPYPQAMQKKINVPVINAGIGSARIDNPESPNCCWQEEINEHRQDIPRCQLMTVMFGINDYNDSYETLTQLQDKYEDCLNQIEKLNPSIKIVGMTPLLDFNRLTHQSNWEVIGKGGYTLHQLTTVIEQVLTKHHATIINWGTLSQNHTRMGDDWLHPNQDLYHDIANIVSSVVQSQLATINQPTTSVKHPSIDIHTSQPKIQLKTSPFTEAMTAVLNQLAGYHLIQPLIDDGVNCLLHYFNGSKNLLVGWTFSEDNNSTVNWGGTKFTLTYTPQIFLYNGVILIPFKRIVRAEDLRDVMNLNIDKANAILSVFDATLISGEEDNFDAIPWIVAHRYDRQFYEEICTAFNDLAQRLSLLAGYFTGTFDADTGEIELPDLWLPDNLLVDKNYLRHINENWVLIFNMLNKSLQIVQTTDVT